MNDRQDAAWDHARDHRKNHVDVPQTHSVGLQQLLAASALIVILERIASAGILAEEDESDVRRLIVRCCNAFDIPTQAERVG